MPLATAIVVENHAFAKPFLGALGLKRSYLLEKIRSYSNESVLLVESRGGIVGTAVTTSYLLGRLGCDAATRLFHVGVSCPVSAAGRELVGKVVLVNRVRDAASGRSYFPDILLAHELAEAGVETLPPGRRREVAPQESSSRAGGSLPPATALRLATAAPPAAPPPPAAAPPLCDEELSGFLAAALTFLAPHQVYCLQVVLPAAAASAPGGETTVGAARGAGEEGASAGGGGPEGTGGHAPRAGRGAEALLEGALGAILRLIAASADLVQPVAGVVSNEGKLAEVKRRMRLTASQAAQLERLVKAAAAQGKAVDSVLEEWESGAEIRTKQERAKRFDELKQRLKQ